MIVVIGASGTIGQHVVQTLLDSGQSVVAVVRDDIDYGFDCPTVQYQNHPDAPSVIQTIREYGNVGMIINCSGCFSRDITQSVNANFIYPVTIIDLLIAEGCRYVVNISTLYKKYKPHLPYTRSKTMLDEHLKYATVDYYDLTAFVINLGYTNTNMTRGINFPYDILDPQHVANYINQLVNYRCPGFHQANLVSEGQRLYLRNKCFVFV